MSKQNCGTCTWWNDSGKTWLKGTCTKGIPFNSLPYWVREQLGETAFTYKTNGETCATWKAKP